MIDRLSLLNEGLRKCNDLLSLHPGNAALISISKQIEYLTELEMGKRSDRSQLKNITIGILTAREIDVLDDATEIFYQIASEAKYM